MLASPGAHAVLSALHIPEAQVLSTDMLQFPLSSQVGVVRVPPAQVAVPQTVPAA